MTKRLFIISNRLPVSIEKVNNQIRLHTQTGSLPTAINSFISGLDGNSNHKFSDIFWLGYPGCTQGEWVEAKKQLKKSPFHHVPVFVNKNIYNDYFNGFSKSVIWPLFHYFPSQAIYNIDFFENYLKANIDYYDEAIRNIRETDTVWIHDYHLLPLAKMIRDRFNKITIGLFVHIPFPSHELFKMMPLKWQQQLLKGMLGADLIGFQTIDYATHFLKSLQTSIDAKAENNIIKFENRLIKIDAFPFAIEYEKFNEAFNIKEVGLLREKYLQQFKGKKILFSVDKLDNTAGVFTRLQAYEWFLNLYPQYKEQVVFINVIVPIIDTLDKYLEKKSEIDEYIGSINSRIGTITWKPIVYQYADINNIEALALYTACDVAVITPLRDGMNLPAKEFVASRKNLEGVLILSETTGAARELTDALLVNPNDLDGFANKINEALTMLPANQAKRMDTMQSRLKQYDAKAWTEDFLTQLALIKLKQREFEFMFLDRDSRTMIYEKYHASNNRLLLLDYDGTLVSFYPEPELCKPGESLLKLLSDLCSNPRNTVYIITGRDSRTLENWLGHLPVNLVAEHGAKIRKVDGEWDFNENILNEEHWKNDISTLMETYVKRCSNSFIEEKEFSIVWHYRNAEPQQGKVRASELFSELNRITSHLNVEVIAGNKIIEVRLKGIDKGIIVEKLLKEKKFDFVFACGDDKSDEDMFKVLANNNKAYTIKIGDTASYAKYNLYTPQMAISLLGFLENRLF